MDEERVPSMVVFAVPEEYYILLKKAEFMRTYETTLILVPTNESAEFYYNGWRDKGIGYVERNKVTKNSAYFQENCMFLLPLCPPTRQQLRCHEI
jgi:hypothetical protein